MVPSPSNRIFARLPNLVLGISGLGLVLVAGLAGCDRGLASGMATSPQAAPPVAKAGEIVLSYGSQEARLRQGLTVAMTVTGDGAVDVRATLVGTLKLAPAGVSRLRVMAQVEELQSFSALGEGFDTKKTEADHREQIEGSKFESFIDFLGVVEEREKNEPAESSGEGSEEADSEIDPASISLVQLLGAPVLPKRALKLGETVVLARQQETRAVFGRLEVPMELDYSYTLVALRTVEGHKVATVDVLVEGGGAAEIKGNQRSFFVSTLEETELRLVFDLTEKMPVSLKGYQASEVTVEFGGQEKRFEQNLEIESTYTVVDANGGADSIATP